MASTSTDSGYVNNWQTGKTVTECNLHMLTTEDCSDVIFRVGSEKQVFRAHRYVLISRSCVFYAMFCGLLAEKGEVTIPDIEADVFREFLRYLYTDAVNITSENITGLLYTSRKYAVDGLLAICSSYLENSLSEDNVCQILEQCHDYGELDLEQKALAILTEAGEKVIKSPGFLNLCEVCLQKFLKSELLNLKETDVFQSVVSWTKEKCKKENENDSSENFRKCLGDMICEIRFTAFSQEYLVNVVGPSGLLTKEERLNILERTVNTNVDIAPFKTTLRKATVLKVTTYGAVLSDIESDILKSFRYIYTNAVNITAESITGLLYTSRKYAVDALLKQYAAVLENSLSDEDMCQILEQCHDYNELGLQQKAMKTLTEIEEKKVKVAMRWRQV